MSTYIQNRGLPNGALQWLVDLPQYQVLEPSNQFLPNDVIGDAIRLRYWNAEYNGTVMRIEEWPDVLLLVPRSDGHKDLLVFLCLSVGVLGTRVWTWRFSPFVGQSVVHTPTGTLWPANVDGTLEVGYLASDIHPIPVVLPDPPYNHNFVGLCNDALAFIERLQDKENAPPYGSVPIPVEGSNPPQLLNHQLGRWRGRVQFGDEPLPRLVIIEEVPQRNLYYPVWEGGPNRLRIFTKLQIEGMGEAYQWSYRQCGGWPYDRVKGFIWSPEVENYRQTQE